MTTETEYPAEIDLDQEEAWDAYADWVGQEYANPSDFQDAYGGEWASEQEFAENLLDDVGGLSGMEESLQCYFDYEAFARDLFMTDYSYVDGFVFRNL